MRAQPLPADDVKAILQSAADVLKKEPNLLEIEAPVTVITSWKLLSTHSS